jgi:superfamily II DNA or RNA helicase
MKYLLNIEERNEFISKVATKLKGNTLILFQRHSQADAIEKIIRESGRTLYRVDGKVKSEDREHARKSVELLDTQTEESAIILASYPTFQAGINIKNLHNIIFASPTKSMIRIIQSIGRVLRTHHSKDKAIVVDIFDDFEYNGKNKNHTMVHFLERYSIYKQGKFNTTVGNGITIDVSGISLEILLLE